jgi:hypothetical protein
MNKLYQLTHIDADKAGVTNGMAIFRGLVFFKHLLRIRKLS